MYSPKIREDLIPRIYQAAKEAGLAMTKWVNQVLEHALSQRQMKNRKETDSHEQ
jgi:hypothetical protein